MQPKKILKFRFIDFTFTYMIFNFLISTFEILCTYTPTTIVKKIKEERKTIKQGFKVVYSAVLA